MDTFSHDRSRAAARLLPPPDDSEAGSEQAGAVHVPSQPADADRTPSALTAHGGAAFERFARRTVEISLNHLKQRPALKAGANPTDQDLKELTVGALPEDPTDPEILLDRIERHYLNANSLSSHVDQHAFVPSPANKYTAYFNLLSTVHNVCAAAYTAAPAGTEVELEVIGWIRDLIGLPASADGLLTSGGSEAQLTALCVARHAKLGDRPHPDAVAYASAEAHSSVSRALRILGFGPEQLRLVPVDLGLRMDPAALRALVERDRAAGRRPFAVVATAGSTNTGACDPLREISALCRENGLWMHVDGAFGAAAAIGTDETERARVAGIELADSLIIDPHKCLYQPFDCGAVLVRDGELLAETFGITPPYLRACEGRVNLYDRGIATARKDRALGLWASLQAIGKNGLVEAIDHGYRMAREAERYLRYGTCWQVLSPAQMGVITFRYVSGDWGRLDEIQRRIEALGRTEGTAMILTTSVYGHVAQRLMVNHPESTYERLHMTIDRLARLGARAATELGQG